ncbi:MAG: hypothetical protein Q7Q73_19055 [Verrucomicrobiota bacterium JB024]|nr:hypothetical protein [Verrucomicrobiota bacterium JB024]
MKTTSLIVFIFSVLSVCQADVIFSDDFNSYEPGPLPKGDNWSTSGNATVVADSGSLFGPNNQYLEMSQTGSDGGANIASKTLVMPDQGMISFDFSIPSAMTGGVNFRIGTGNSNGSTAFAIRLASGTTSGQRVYSTLPNMGQGSILSNNTLGTVDHVTIIYNNTASPYSYNIGSFVSTLDANTMDVWVGTTLVGDNLGRSGGLAKGTPLSMINFISPSTDTILDIWVDNIVVQDANIPEASSYSLIGGLCALLFFLRRRSIRKTVA